jgi:transcription antitermination factor NusG
MPKFEKGDKVRVRSDCTSPYEGCTGVVEGVIKEESGFLYIVQFGRSGDLALTDNFMEEDLQTVGN